MNLHFLENPTIVMKVHNQISIKLIENECGILIKHLSENLSF